MSEIIRRKSSNELLELLPPYERTSKVFKEITNAEQIEFNKLDSDLTDLEKQFFIDTATWGLEIYEKELGLKTNLNKPLEERRSVIKSKWRGTGKVDRLLIKAVVDAYTNGGVDVGFDGKIIVTFNDVRGRPSNMEDVYNTIEKIIPAHLAIMYEFLYTTCQELIDWQVTCNELFTMICDDMKTYGKEVI